MFKTRKELRRKLYAEQRMNDNLRSTNEMLANRIFQHKAEEKNLREQLADTELSLAAAYKQRDELLVANGELKREAAREHEKNEKLVEQVMQLACPDDCKGHGVNSPGGSYCRACIRNPHAKDKYEAVT